MLICCHNNKIIKKNQSQNKLIQESVLLKNHGNDIISKIRYLNRIQNLETVFRIDLKFGLFKLYNFNNGHYIRSISGLKSNFSEWISINKSEICKLYFK